MAEQVEGDVDDDVRVPWPLETFAAWLGPPRGYSLTRWLVLRLLGVVYAFAFLGIAMQGPALLGSHGLTPAASYLDQLRSAGQTFWDVPTIFFADSSDAMLQACAYLGLAFAIAVAIGYANLPILAALWLLYGSFERVGQIWWGFGWEIQLLETGLIAALLAHPWDPRPLASRPPPTTAIVLLRWLAFRIMLGAGLIKLRGDGCWRALTCLDSHFETQPIPNPLSPWFHQLPHAAHAVGVVFNHVVEVVAPWFVFGPRRLRLVAGALMAAFQLVLIVSGNLAFLNWLTLVPILACFDDDALLAILPRRARLWVAARLPARPPRNLHELAAAFGVAAVAVLIWEPVTGWLGAPLQVALGAALVIAACVVWRKRDLHQLAIGAFAAVVAIKSVPVIENLKGPHQAMNLEYDRLAIVNTYGAFGSVGMARYELVIEGTRDADPEHATWLPYELPCKPGDVARRPCVLGPYHRRLDWLIWFAAMDARPHDPWVIHLVWKLLDGDPTIRTLLAVDPFDGAAPAWIRIRRFRYRFAPSSSSAWWIRSDDQPWLGPVSKATPGFREALAGYGWAD
jgi:Lipase maturation factor